MKMKTRGRVMCLSLLGCAHASFFSGIGDFASQGLNTLGNTATEALRKGGDVAAQVGSEAARSAIENNPYIQAGRVGLNAFQNISGASPGAAVPGAPVPGPAAISPTGAAAPIPTATPAPPGAAVPVPGLPITPAAAPAPAPVPVPAAAPAPAPVPGLPITPAAAPAPVPATAPGPRPGGATGTPGRAAATKTPQGLL